LKQVVIADFDMCSGCRICELACSTAKGESFAPRKARIYVSTQASGLMAQPIVCHQCNNPFCMRGCPFDAIQRDENMGIVNVIAEKCNGCGLCVRCCPVNAIKVDPKTRKALKCDTCIGSPTCVSYCPTGALSFVKY